MDKRSIFTPCYLRTAYDLDLLKGLLIRKQDNRYLSVYLTQQTKRYTAAYVRLAIHIQDKKLEYTVNYGAAVYCWVNGTWPVNVLDHIDNNTTNNVPWNLRDVTQRENSQNKVNNNKGVYWNKSKAKWHAQIRINGIKTYLGLFADIQDAQQAYKNACAIHKIPCLY